MWPVEAPGLQNPKRVLGFKTGPPETNMPGWQMRGIYELTGNKLELRMSQPGGDYPANLENGVGSYFTLKRR